MNHKKSSSSTFFMKKERMKKGQIFSLDVLAALVAVTVALGYFSWQLEDISARTGDIEYSKISTLAEDWAQIAVKSKAVSEPNVIDNASLAAFAVELGQVLRPGYNYEITAGQIKLGNCTGRLTASDEVKIYNSASIASARRIIYDNATGETQEFILKICSA